MANINSKSNSGKSGKGNAPSFVQSKESKAKVKGSDTGKNGGQTRAPKGSSEGLKGGNKKVARKGQAGH